MIIQDTFRNTLNTNTTPPSWQAVFFDFDGVIADSTEVKVRAFATLFATYGPEVQKAVIRYHLDNGGMPRHQKIRHCFEIFAGLTPTDSELSRAGQTFSNLVLEEVVAAIRRITRPRHYLKLLVALGSAGALFMAGAIVERLTAFIK